MSYIPAGIIITLLLLCIGGSIILGGIAWARTTSLFLPFPISVSAIAALFPILSVVLVLATKLLASRFERANDRKRITSSNGTTHAATTSQTWLSFRPFLAFILDNLLTILPTILATIAATYVAPSDNNCHLEQAWQAYYHNKDVNAIRTIQDRLQCCGLRSTRDRAWPFKDGTHGDDACERSLGYGRSCLDPWSENERRIAVFAVVAAIAGWGIKLGYVYLGFRTQWTSPNDTRANATGSRTGGPSAIPRLLRYSDDPNEVQDDRHEERPDNDYPQGRNSLIDSDGRDVTSPDGRDLSGTGPWRESV